MSVTTKLTAAALASLLSVSMMVGNSAFAAEEKQDGGATKTKATAEKAHCRSKKKGEKYSCKMCCAGKGDKATQADKVK